jgi:hypothetical protein
VQAVAPEEQEQGFIPELPLEEEKKDEVSKLFLNKLCKETILNKIVVVQTKIF